MEKWEIINGYDNYKISDTGKVALSKTGRILSGYNKYRKNKDGSRHIHACYIDLSRNNVRKKYAIHFLVASHFLKNQKQAFHNSVDHIDRNPLNNKVSNLRWANRIMQNQNRKNLRSKVYPKIKVSDMDVMYFKAKEHSLEVAANHFNIPKMGAYWLLRLFHHSY